MFGPPGRAYVYPIHSRHCFNVVTGADGAGTAVLIRAVEPIDGIDLMQAYRQREKRLELARGPGRLCQAFAIDRRLDHWNLTLGRTLWLAAAGVRVTMCGEHHWRCEVSYEFGADARLLAWRGRVNSWPKVVRTLLPSAEELNGLYSVMALLVCLGAAATAREVDGGHGDPDRVAVATSVRAIRDQARTREATGGHRAPRWQ